MDIIGTLFKHGFIIRGTERVRSGTFHVQHGQNPVLQGSRQRGGIGVDFMVGLVHLVFHVKRIGICFYSPLLVEITAAVLVIGGNGTAHLVSVIRQSHGSPVLEFDVGRVPTFVVIQLDSELEIHFREIPVQLQVGGIVAVVLFLDHPFLVGITDGSVILNGFGSPGNTQTVLVGEGVLANDVEPVRVDRLVTIGQPVKLVKTDTAVLVVHVGSLVTKPVAGLLEFHSAGKQLAGYVHAFLGIH